MATPRKKRVDASAWPSLSDHQSPSVHEDVVIGLIPALQEIVAWWETRKATLEQASDASRETERITFHVEQRWIEAIRRQADLDGFTYTQIVNEAFRQYFEGL
jgi:predicted DNA binding CopG/RHH family protein